MTATIPPKKSKPTTSPSTARRSARNASSAGRRSSRGFDRAGTSRSGGGISPLVGWTIAAVAVAVVVLGVAYLASTSTSAVGSDLKTPTVLTPTNITWNGNTLGMASAPVTVDVYGDFRCSGCAVFTENGTEASLVNDFVATGRAKLVWHDRLIIDEIRVDGTASRDAANAAMCAADQNKFWIMHDWLFANQSPVEDSSAFTMTRLSSIGKAAGLDMAKFQPCLDAGTYNAQISAADAGEAKVISSTPTVYVNQKLVASPSYTDIKTAIDAEPAAAPTATPAPATPTPAPTPTQTPTLAPSETPSVKPS
ncbi:MAG TPA: thioredoxin domain-containing protein [Candidatus Limnocylindrales bacterium]